MASTTTAAEQTKEAQISIISSDDSANSTPGSEAKKVTSESLATNRASTSTTTVEQFDAVEAGEDSASSREAITQVSLSDIPAATSSNRIVNDESGQDGERPEEPTAATIVEESVATEEEPETDSIETKAMEGTASGGTGSSATISAPAIVDDGDTAGAVETDNDDSGNRSEAAVEVRTVPSDVEGEDLSTQPADLPENIQ